jgi:hypothetical protein
MADYYVDHLAYGTLTTNRIGVDVPTWGVPQEGDGNTLTPSSVSSTGSIVINAISSTGNTVSVCGINFTASASRSAGSSNFVNGATTLLTADNLATALNDCVTLVSVSVAYGTPRISTLIYARGPTLRGDAVARVDIMMRVGSTTLNFATNSSVGFASAGWSSAPTFTNFSGGISGCWGWLCNGITNLGNGNVYTPSNYGIAVAKPLVWTSTITYRDTIWCRTGSGRTLDMSTNNWSRGTGSAMGFPLTLIFDTNTKWTGDSGVGVFQVNFSAPAFAYVHFRPDYSANSGQTEGTSFIALMRGGFRIEIDLSQASATLDVESSGYTRLHNVEFAEKALPVGNNSRFNINCPSTNTYVVTSCNFKFLQTRTNLVSPFLAMGNSSGYWTFEDCDFQYNLTGSQATVDAIAFVSSSGPTALLKFENNRFSTNGAGTQGGLPLKWFTGGWIQSTVQVILNRNVGIKLPSSALGFQSAPSKYRSNQMCAVLGSSGDAGRSLRYETPSGIAEWDYTANYPYFSATQIEGTPWSMRMDWFQGGVLTPPNPFIGPKMTKINRLATGVRTIVTEFLVDSTRTINANQMGIVVSYVDSSNVPRRESTYYVTAPVTSTAAWSIPGVWSSYIPKKLTVVTSYPVLINSEISVEVVLCNEPSGSGNAQLFYDPEFQLT